MHTRTALIASLLAFALVGAACSGNDADETTTTTEGEAAAPSVEVRAVDYGYAGLPAEIAAGTEIKLVNESDTELHEFVAIKLADDDTRSAVELVQLPPEELGALFASVTTVIIAPPNEAGFPVEGTGVLTEPGRYAIICAIPTGADPDEYLAAAAEAEGGPPQVDGGPPHFVQGMVTEVTVVDG